MSNVPSHSRTRRSHRHGLSAGGSRRTHQHSGYLPALEGAEQVYEQISIDEAGQVTAGQISPGAIHDPAQFAAGIQPVLLVDGLPTLPDLGYPEDIIVFDISVTPRVLYKNEADVWVKLIGPDDIQANSITAGQIAAGAVSTSELAVGARLTGEVANEEGATPGVFIDETGILIRDGKLTLEDEFGLTTMEASGFSGSWQDFAALGLYNGRFRAGVAGVIPNGRTVSLPYWTVSNDAGSPVADFQAGGGVEVTFAAVDTGKKFVSDRIPVLGATEYSYGIGWDRSSAVGTSVRHDVWIEWYDAAGASLGQSQVGGGGGGSGFSAGPGAIDVSPDSAAFAELAIVIEQITGHDAANFAMMEFAWLRPQTERLGFLRVDDLEVGINSASSTVAQFLGDIAIFGNGLLMGAGSDSARIRYSASVLEVDDGAGGPVPDMSVQADAVALSGQITAYGSASGVPTINNRGSGTVTGASYVWCRLGNVVFFQVDWTMTAAGSGASSVTVTGMGLPVSTNARILGDRGGVGVTTLIGRLTVSGDEEIISAIATIAAPGTPLTGADLADGAAYSFHGMYFVT